MKVMFNNRVERLENVFELSESCYEGQNDDNNCHVYHFENKTFK